MLGDHDLRAARIQVRDDPVGVEGLVGDQAAELDSLDQGANADRVEALNERGATICISQRPHRIEPLEIDPEIYKWRHLIENFFCKLKEFKRIALRACKTDTSFSAMIHLCSAFINSRSISTGPSLRRQKLGRTPQSWRHRI